MKIEAKVGAENIGERLDIFLKKNSGDVSREKIKKAILNGHALINGQVTRDPSLSLNEGQVVEIEINISDDLSLSELDIKKVYEDDDFLVINKPSGMVVHPGAGVDRDTLANILITKYPEMRGVGHKFRPGIVHRLDKDTSGLLLVAKNEQALDYAKKVFKDKDIKKEYVALVHGRLEKPHGFIDMPLILDHKRKKVKVSLEGRQAKTEYTVLGYYQDPKSPALGQEVDGERSRTTHGNPERSRGVDFYTLVRVILHTGRTHQIRVHFSHLSHPLAGDSLYGKGSPLLSGLDRQFLHAKRLTFRLPNGTLLDLISELPEDLQMVLNGLDKV